MLSLLCVFQEINPGIYKYYTSRLHLTWEYFQYEHFEFYNVVITEGRFWHQVIVLYFEIFEARLSARLIFCATRYHPLVWLNSLLTSSYQKIKIETYHITMFWVTGSVTQNSVLSTFLLTWMISVFTSVWRYLFGIQPIFIWCIRFFISNLAKYKPVSVWSVETMWCSFVILVSNSNYWRIVKVTGHLKLLAIQ